MSKSIVEHFGKYFLLERLASGGMAEVYLAKSTGAVGVNKFVAIKRILPQYSDNIDYIEMFKEEAKITVNLNHGNVVSIYDFGIERQQFFLVMEYVEGRNLRQVITEMKRSSTQFTIEQIVYMIKEVAAGLDHAHRCIDGTSGRPLNITHRDMSPQNIMVSFEGEVKIIDFGIAKAETQIEATKAGTLKGKFGYMSPEQADGQTIDLRTDIFSLGIVMWELLANDRLFTSNSEAAILRKIRECQISSIRKINPSVPPELERIVNKALAKDKSLRYQTAAAFHRDLNRFLNTEYPEFSPHDFSVFMKNSFSQAFLEQRKRLIEYSKLQAEAIANLDKTVITQTDHRAEQRTAYKAPPAPRRSTTEPAKSVSDAKTNIDRNELDIDTATNIKVSLENLKSVNTSSSSARSSTLSTNTGITDVTSTGIINHPAIGRTKKASLVYNNSNSSQMTSGRDKMEHVTTWAMRIVIMLILGVGTWMLYKNPAVIKPYFAGFSDLLKNSIPQNTTVQPVPKDTPGQADLAATAQYVVTIESKPPGARIFIDGQDTQSFTPNRRKVLGNTALALTLKKDGYLNYETSSVVSADAQSLKATLQPVPKAAYISVNLINGGINPVLEVNGQRLNESLPIEKYTIPAGIPVKIRAHNPFTGAKAEQTVTIKENQKKLIELILK